LGRVAFLRVYPKVFFWEGTLWGRGCAFCRGVFCASLFFRGLNFWATFFSGEGFFTLFSCPRKKGSLGMGCTFLGPLLGPFLGPGWRGSHSFWAGLFVGRPLLGFSPGFLGASWGWPFKGLARFSAGGFP